MPAAILRFERLENRLTPTAVFLDGPTLNYLAGFVFVDVNNDGLRAVGQDFGISGQTVELVSDAGWSVAALTDQFGKYIFYFVPPGTYSLVQQQPFGLFDGKDTPGGRFDGTAGPVGTDSIVGIQVPADLPVIADDYNFAELVPGEIAGFVYEDVNNNSEFSANEPGIPGVVLTLTGVNDLGQLISLTTTTSTDGSYKFTDLRPGEYVIAERQPAGFDDGHDAAGTIGGKVENDLITEIRVDGFSKGREYRFGERLKPQTSFLSGHVYRDRDNNGVKDATEEGFAGVLVTLRGPGGVLSATTQSDGSYAFSGLTPGNYVLIEHLDEEKLALRDGIDSLGTPFVGSIADDRFAVAVTAGKVGAGFNFGELRITDVIGMESNLLSTSSNRSASVRDSAFARQLAAAATDLFGTDEAGITSQLNSTLKVVVSGPNAGVDTAPPPAAAAFGAPVDSGETLVGLGEAVERQDIFGPETPILESTNDAQTSAALAGSLVTGGRVRTAMESRKGAAIGSVAMMTRGEVDAEPGTELDRNALDEFSVLNCLIGPANLSLIAPHSNLPATTVRGQMPAGDTLQPEYSAADSSMNQFDFRVAAFVAVSSAALGALAVRRLVRRRSSRLPSNLAAQDRTEVTTH